MGPLRDEQASTRNGGTRTLGVASKLDRRSWIHWYLFVGIAIVTTLGLGSSIASLVRGRVASPWPWVNTDFILLAGLSITVLLFAGYLTYQQRQVSALRSELLRANEAAARRIQSHYDRLVALLNVSRVLATETNPQNVFDAITRTCLETFDCQQSSLMLFDQESEELEVRSVSGHDESAKELATVRKLGQGIAGWVANERKPFVLGPHVDAAGAAPGPPGNAPLPAAAMVVPITLRDQLIGVLSVSSSSPDVAYDEEDLQALQVCAETAGVCCRHAEQTTWMRQTIQRLDATLQERGIDGSDWAA